MAQVVNLRLARKAKRRAEADAAATANRAAFGTSQAERVQAAIPEQRRNRLLDATKRES